MRAALDAIKQQLSQLTTVQKAEILRWLVQEVGNAFPGIERQPDIQGGSACIAHTRIPVWGLVEYRQLGATDAQLLQFYPSLTAQDLGNAWAYYEIHHEEIDHEIAENRAA